MRKTINNKVKKFAKKKGLVMPHGYETKKAVGFKRHKKSQRLKEIISLAQKIHKKNPRKKWQSCVKEASKKLHG